MKIIIFGAGAQSKITIDILNENDQFEIIGIIDSKLEIGSMFYGYKIVGRQQNLQNLKKEYSFEGGIIAIGDNYSRYLVSREILKQLPDFIFINAISSFSKISPTAKIGRGNLIMAGNIINSEAEIKDHCMMMTKSTLEHNCLMNNYSSISAGVTTGGFVLIGEFSAIALGVIIFDRVEIGENVVIGSGSLVHKSLESNFLYYGSPIKKIRSRNLNDKFLK